jgi:hypothetical protein
MRKQGIPKEFIKGYLEKITAENDLMYKTIQGADGQV